MKYIEKYWYLIIIVFFASFFYKIGLGLLIFGVIFLAIIIEYLKNLNKIYTEGNNTFGTILFYKLDNEGYKTPVIKFQTNDGKNIEREPYYYASTDLSKMRTYKNNLNQTVPIKYLAKQPEMFIIDNEKSFNYIVIYLFLFAGFVFTFVGLANILGFIKIN